MGKNLLAGANMTRIPFPGISRAAFGLALAFVLAACGDDSSSTAPGLSSVPGSVDPGYSSAGGSGDPGSGAFTACEASLVESFAGRATFPVGGVSAAIPIAAP